MYKIESLFYHKSLPCVVILTSMGHRCGYVGVPETHPLFGKDWGDVDVDVHGGLTYAEPSGDGYPKGVAYPTWWFGFDCAHSWDAPDMDALEKFLPTAQFKRVSQWAHAYSESEVRSQAYVEAECRSLADQLS